METQVEVNKIDTLPGLPAKRRFDMVKERLVSISPPAVPLWVVTEEGTLPVLTLALIERETRSSSDGSRYEVRPLFFDRDLGVTPWDEEYGDILGLQPDHFKHR
jgi:hypothetical protein